MGAVDDYLALGIVALPTTATSRSTYSDVAPRRRAEMRPYLLAVAGAGLAARDEHVQLGLDGLLTVSRELGAASTEQLDPVVGEGIMRCRDHRGRILPARGQPGEPGRRDDTGVDHLAALGREAGGEGGLQHRSGSARVPTHEKRTALQPPRRCPPEGERELGSQLGVGDSTDPVGAETRRHERTRLSAWSTAGPCGPSSSRTSCSPSRGHRE